MFLLKLLWNKWITPASTQIWLLVAGAFGVFLMLVKRMGKKTQENTMLKEEVKRAERIQNVKENTDRDAALDRLCRDGKVRDDKPL